MAKPVNKIDKKTKKAKPSTTSKKNEVEAQAPVDIASRELLKKLASNDEEVRDKAVKTVAQLLGTKRKLEPFQLQKLWKGLWYNMWHSDTPMIQHVLARDLANLVLEVNDKNIADFLKAYYSICSLEWSTLDRYRINKYYMLVRYVLNAQLTRLEQHNWAPSQIAEFVELMIDHDVGALSYSNAKISHSLRLHVVDIYLDELEKVIDAAKKKPSKEQIELLLKPVLSQIEYTEFKHVKQMVLRDIVPDERLVTWGITEPPAKEEDEVTSEWEGFD